MDAKAHSKQVAQLIQKHRSRLHGDQIHALDHNEAGFIPEKIHSYKVAREVQNQGPGRPSGIRKQSKAPGYSYVCRWLAQTAPEALSSQVLGTEANMKTGIVEL